MTSTWYSAFFYDDFYVLSFFRGTQLFSIVWRIIEHLLVSVVTSLYDSSSHGRSYQGQTGVLINGANGFRSIFRVLAGTS